MEYTNFANITNTDSRVPRTVSSPLLNLILAASILSKLTQAKSYNGQSPWLPFRPVFGYYQPEPQLQLPQIPIPNFPPSIWYPVDPYFQHQAYPSLTTNTPQLQPPAVNQQQIIHIHEPPPLTAEADYDVSQKVNNFSPTASDGDTDATATNQEESTLDSNDPLMQHENMEEAASNSNAVLNTIVNPLPTMNLNTLSPDENIQSNEIPEPSDPYGKPVIANRFNSSNLIQAEVSSIIPIISTNKPSEILPISANNNITVSYTTVTNIPTFLLNTMTTTMEIVTPTVEEMIYTATQRIPAVDSTTGEFQSITDEISFTDLLEPTMFDQVAAESNVDLQVSAANIYNRKKKPVQDEYYDEYYTQNRLKMTLAPIRIPPPHSRPYKTQATRINSKRGQYRPLKLPDQQYDDDYDYTTQRSNRRKPTQRRTTQRRRATTPTYDLDYEETTPVRRKNNKNRRRTTTPPAYDDYYDEQYEIDDDDYMYNRQKDQIRPRQQTTTTTEAATTETTESSITTDGSSSTSTTTTQASTGTMKPMTSSTTVGYPYPAHGHGNVSTAYGPPSGHHAGYGPSNGYENISITYGPPTGQHNVGPLLDAWYNQYAKTSVIKRIQELLTPNNYYSPQYDVDKFSYNDNNF